MERTYRITPTWADRVLWLAEAVAFFLAMLAAFSEKWLVAAVLFVVYIAIMLKLQERGVFTGKPFLVLTGSELTFRQPFYIPTKVQKVALDGVRTLSIAGPSGDRRFVFSYADGSRVKVRPFLRGVEQGAIEFLKHHLSGIGIEEKHPPGVFDVIRGDY